MTPSISIMAILSALALGAAEPALAQRRAVPRPGGGRAVGPPLGRPGGVGAPYRPYYPYYPSYGYGYPYYRYGYPYGFGVGFSFSFGYPYYYGVYPYAYGGYPYPSYYPYGYGGYGYPVATYGEVKIRGAARDAQVFVDNSYAGIVDDFDGTFQHLNLAPGTHQIEIRRPGAAPLSFDVRIDAGRTITYHATTEP
jgi:hypothetical protein